MPKRQILDPAIVARLREMDAKGLLVTREAARLYGVSTETIRRAVRGDTWTTLPSPAKAEEEAQSSQEKLQILLAQEQARREVPKQVIEELEGLDVAKQRGYLD